MEDRGSRDRDKIKIEVAVAVKVEVEVKIEIKVDIKHMSEQFYIQNIDEKLKRLETQRVHNKTCISQYYSLPFAHCSFSM